MYSRLFEDNVCDFVGLGRASIADPEWCKKAKQGCNDSIHHCIGCLYCFESLLSAGYVRCSVNPRAGREAALAKEPEQNGKGTKVAVVGAGLTGLETAEKLFRMKAADSVTVIDMVPQIGASMYPAIFVDVTHQMDGEPLTLLPSRKLKEITSAGIIAENIAEGKDEEIAADYVILAMGTRVDRDLIKSYEESFDRVICLGQTHKNPGRIATSMTEAYIAARGFDPIA